MVQKLTGSLALLIFGVCVAGGSVTGCGSSGRRVDPVLAQPASPVDGAAYFPLKAGNRWSYIKRQTLGEGSEETTTLVFEAESWTAPDGSAGCRLNDPSRGLLNPYYLLLARTPKGILSYLGLFGIGKTVFDTPVTVLPATIGAKETWAWAGTTKGVPFSVVGMFQGLEDVKVPAGAFQCLRIRFDLERGGELSHWYARGVGLVKMEAAIPARGNLPESHHAYELEHYTVR